MKRGQPTELVILQDDEINCIKKARRLHAVQTYFQDYQDSGATRLDTGKSI